MNDMNSCGCRRERDLPTMRELEYACLHPSFALFANDPNFRDRVDEHIASGLSKPFAKKKRV